MKPDSTYYAGYKLRIIILEQRGLELRYNHNHDEKGRFTFSSGGRVEGIKSYSDASKNSPKNSRAKVENTVDFSDESDIIESGIEYLGSKPKLAKHGIDDCYDTANPHYGEGKEYELNCQRCVIAYEARRRGFDVIAKPAVSGDEPLKRSFGENGWANVFEDGKNGLLKVDGSTPAEIKENICAFMKKSGDGTRAIIEIHNNGGHAFIAEQVKGKTIFLDPQIGLNNAEIYFEFELIPNTTKLLRTDNKKFTSRIEECVE